MIAFGFENDELNENFHKYFSVRTWNWKYDYSKINLTTVSRTNGTRCTSEHFSNNDYI